MQRRPNPTEERTMNRTTDQDDHARLATERVASAWRWDAALERLAADPALLDRLPARHRLALGTYMSSKQAAAETGVDVTDPKGTR
jgi:hypothetical protein